MLIAILGRQPKLGLAELESKYGADKVRPLGSEAAYVDVHEIPQKQVGGAIKIAKVLTDSRLSWHENIAFVQETLPTWLTDMPEGKIKLGLSAYSTSLGSKQLFQAGLELKKIIRTAGRSVRIVPNTASALNSAQVLHNQLTGPLGIELLFIGDGEKTILAQTISVQNVDDYARRDYHRPRRDAFVGMLPPKLAQIMLNLAHPPKGATILDPFCGTGVVLMEAALMGYRVYGSDISDKMIRYSRDNLNWLGEAYRRRDDWFLEEADAQTHTWRPPITTVACETYLGQPLSGLPSSEKLDSIIQNCNDLTEKFLRNLHKQLDKGSRHCIAVPTWRVQNAFRHLPILDHLEEIGYNRLRLKYASWDDLIYHREDQIVGRELLVIEVR